MSPKDERIHQEPAGPGSAAWRAKLRMALDGSPWLIVTRSQPAEALTRDLLAELAGLPRLDERAAEANFDRVADAAAKLYRLPIQVARRADMGEAQTLAEEFIAGQGGARALVQG